MALACDQCRRVPPNTERGERHHWIRTDVPKGMMLAQERPPQYSGMLHGVSHVVETMQFCSVGCIVSFFVSAEQRITNVQHDSLEIMREVGALPDGMHEGISRNDKSDGSTFDVSPVD